MGKLGIAELDTEHEADAAGNGPVLGDGDGEDESDNEIVFIPDEKPAPLCTWSEDQDEHRRVFVFDRMADSNIDGKILVENMDHVYRWLKDATVPKKTKGGIKSE